MLTLKEALPLTRQTPPPGAAALTVHLACGFMPLHLQTFLHASLVSAAPDRAIQIKTGLFGDFCGNLERLSAGQADVCVAQLEWSDLDARLGLRSLGSWHPGQLNDILDSVRRTLSRAAAAIDAMSAFVPVVVSPPTLPLPPVSNSAVSSSGPFEMELQAAVLEFARRIWKPGVVRVLSTQQLDLLSATAERLDVTSEQTAGFPYTRTHAAVLGEELAKLVLNRPPLKGIVTDLDDTLWKGIVGEVGPANVGWDLAAHAQPHGLYQRLLASLAGAGVLVGVASKNDPKVVAEAFERADLILTANDVFPREVGWHPKSESVSRILKAWNIGAGDVVFVDDSPMELEEVKRAHPAIQTRLFPSKDPQAAYRLLVELRELFGKPAVSGEDAIRASSLRTGQMLEQAVSEGGANLDEFLSGLAPVFTLRDASASTRALELVNKTNQFNLNGVRQDWAAWSVRTRTDTAAFQWVIAYSDKFGPLGEIAVAAGRRDGGKAVVDTWVMSCRAFSRRIEHQTLRLLFDKLGVSSVVLEHKATERNGPLREFLETIPHAADAAGRTVIGKTEFTGMCPALYFRLEDGVSAGEAVAAQ